MLANSFGNFFTIDWKLLPIKLHFFFYAIALASATAFFPVLGVNIGFSKTALGIILTTSTFTTMLTNPLFGWITDKLQKITLVMIVMIVIQIPFFIGGPFVPALDIEKPSTSVEVVCSYGDSYRIKQASISTNLPTDMNLRCTFNCFSCPDLESDAIDNVTLCVNHIKFESQGDTTTSLAFPKAANMSVQGIHTATNCEENANNTCQASCTHGELVEKNEFTSYQFWIFFTVVFGSIVFSSATLGLGDAACYEALEGKVNQFGKQKVWMTVGWGAGTAVTGYLLDFSRSFNGGKVDFRYPASIMLFLTVLDIITLSRTNLKKPEASKHILKDFCNVFTRLHPFFFTAATILVGCCAGIQRTYQFVYLEKLGASKLLLGVSDGVLCLLVEVPFIFISGWIVKNVGRDNCVLLAFSSYATWFIAASFINNPWWILLVNMCEGPSLGLFGVAMSSYGNSISAAGTEATTQTFLTAMLLGLGMGSGSLLGGLGYDSLGGRRTFRYSGFLAIGITIIYRLLTFLVAGEHTVTPGEEEKEVKMTVVVEKLPESLCTPSALSNTIINDKPRSPRVVMDVYAIGK